MERIVKPAKRIELRGAHRGGTCATRALLERATPAPLEVRIIDQTAGRAATLAADWTRAGHTAIVATADARAVPIAPDLDVLGLCTDDAAVQLQMLEQAQARLLVVGMLLAATEVGRYGGTVLGFGASVPGDDTSTRRDAIRVFQEIVRLTAGTRVSSRRVSDPVLNGLQVEPVREALYRRLAQDAHEFLATGRAHGGLYVTTLWPAIATYRMELQARQGRSRSAMKAEAERRARSLRSSNLSEPRAVTYLDGIASMDGRRNVDGTAPWLFTVVPGRYGETMSVELPESPAAQTVRDARQARAAAAVSRSVFATD